MGSDLVEEAEQNEAEGRYITAFGAYLSACLVSATGLTVLNGMALDFRMIGFLAAVVFFAALIPFAVTKAVMIRFAWDDAVSHGAGGAIAAISAILLFGYWRLLTPGVIISFLFWGGIAGLVYWGVRRIGRRLFTGTTE